MYWTDFLNYQLGIPDLIIIVVGTIYSIFVPLITLHKKDSVHFFWKNKKIFEKVIFIPLLFFAYILMRFMFAFFYYGYILLINRGYGIPYLIVIASAMFIDSSYWFLVKKFNLYRNEPILYQQLMNYFIEFLFIGPLMAFVCFKIVELISIF